MNNQSEDEETLDTNFLIKSLRNKYHMKKYIITIILVTIVIGTAFNQTSSAPASTSKALDKSTSFSFRGDEYSLSSLEGKKRIIDLIESLPEKRRQILIKLKKDTSHGTAGAARCARSDAGDEIIKYGIILRAIYENNTISNIEKIVESERNGAVALQIYQAFQGGETGSIVLDIESGGHLEYCEQMTQYYAGLVLQKLNSDSSDWYKKWDKPHQELYGKSQNSLD